MESMSGEHDAAVEHLQAAIALRPAAREWAQGDAELDADPRPARTSRPDRPAPAPPASSEEGGAVTHRAAAAA